MRPPLLALLTLLGCASTNGTLPLGDRPQQPDPVEDTAPPLITEEEIADQEIDDSWLFSDEAPVIHTTRSRNRCVAILRRRLPDRRPVMTLYERSRGVRLQSRPDRIRQVLAFGG